MSKNNKEYQELMAQMRAEFTDDTEEKLNEMELLMQGIRSGTENSKEALTKILRHAHSMKGSGGLADFPLVSLVMHRLEDYLSGIPTLEEKYLDDVLVYLDKARKFSTIDFDQSSVSTAELARQLPDRSMAGIDTSMMQSDTHNVIEVMMVIKEKTAGMLFERELRAAGLRVVVMRNSFEALEMAVRTRPNLIIASGVLDELSGVDVAAAIASMPTTRDIPVCLLTSFEKGHSDLDGLPDKVELIHKNKLKNDLFNVLEKFRLIS